MLLYRCLKHNGRVASPVVIFYLTPMIILLASEEVARVSMP
jgi:hypothetical protein